MNIIPKDPETIRIIQISDTHIAPASADEAAAAANANAAPSADEAAACRSLRATLDHIKREEPPPDLILLTGDLAADPDPRAYRLLADLLRGLTAPVCCLPGNHDDPAMMRAAMQGGPVHTDKVLRLGDRDDCAWAVVLLDTYLPGGPAGRLSRAELEFLRVALERHPRQHILLALHHHPLPCGSPWMDEMMLQNPRELLAIVAAHPTVKVIVWGHIHQEFHHSAGPLLYLGCPSTGVQFKPMRERYERDDLPPGYRLLRLCRDGSVSTIVRRIPPPPSAGKGRPAREF